MTIAAAPALLLESWWWAAGLLVGGYALQFLGHAVEGNDPGEVIVVKRLLGLPYVAISPRWSQTTEGRSRRHKGEGSRQKAVNKMP